MKFDVEALKQKFLNGSLGLTLISILLGFLLGATILIAAGFNPLEAKNAITRSSFSSIPASRISSAVYLDLLGPVPRSWYVYPSRYD